MSAIDERVGKRIHMLMWEQRVTQTAVGSALGIDQSGVSKKLRGKRPWLAADLVTLGGLLGVAPGELLTDVAPLGPTPPTPDDSTVIAPTSSATSARNRAVGRWFSQVTGDVAERDADLLPTG